MSRPYGQTYIGNEKDIPTRASIKSYLVIRLEFFLHFMLVTVLLITLTVKRPTPDVMLDSPSSAIPPAHFFAPTFKESTNTRPKPFLLLLQALRWKFSSNYSMLLYSSFFKSGNNPMSVDRCFSGSTSIRFLKLFFVILIFSNLAEGCILFTS